MKYSKLDILKLIYNCKDSMYKSLKDYLKVRNYPIISLKVFDKNKLSEIFEPIFYCQSIQWLLSKNDFPEDQVIEAIKDAMYTVIGVTKNELWRSK